MELPDNFLCDNCREMLDKNLSLPNGEVAETSAVI